MQGYVKSDSVFLCEGREAVGTGKYLTEIRKISKINTLNEQAQLAQLVEQRTENPRVSGSIPELGT